MPPSARLLNAIWSYRRKRKPTGELFKIKTRICVDGSQQELGLDYWETYAPVVSWSTVRLVMLLSTIMNLHNRQVDYTQAFPQALLDDPIYMKIPQGWYVGSDGKLKQHEDPKHMDKSHFIKLLRNLYGCKQAARNWFTHLNNVLLAQGFKQSSTDSCIYLCHDCLLVVYTDDCLIFAPSEKMIDDLIKSLSENFLLVDQGAVQEFLGIHISKDPNSNSFTLRNLVLSTKLSLMSV